jgi:hypothetical protein
MTRRLESCGVDGLMCEAYYGWNVSLESLARRFKTGVPNIRSRIDGVIERISEGA